MVLIPLELLSFSIGRWLPVLPFTLVMIKEHLEELGKTFIDVNDLTGDLSLGVYMNFSTAGQDLTNPLFKAPQQSGDQIVVHDRMIADALEGDARLRKFGARNEATSQDDLNGTHETRLFERNTDSYSIIRYEELLLILAEASINTNDLGTAIAALDKIRLENGLSPIAGSPTQEELIDEMLFQRRYSLWGEGHQMFDLRRQGRLNADFPSHRPRRR